MQCYLGVKVCQNLYVWYFNLFKKHLRSWYSSKTVLEKLLHAGASINFNKSVLKINEVRFLGHIINENGIRVDISNLKEFELCKLNTHKKSQRMLGHLNWFRPFVKNFAVLTAEFYTKLKKIGKNLHGMKTKSQTSEKLRQNT